MSFVLPRQQRSLTLQAVGNSFQEKLLNRDAAEAVVGVTLLSSAFGGFAARAVTGEMGGGRFGYACFSLGTTDRNPSLVRDDRCWMLYGGFSCRLHDGHFI